MNREKQDSNSSPIDFVVRMQFGSMEYRDWMEYKDGKLVGMCSRVERDEDGKIIDYNVEPTGIFLHIDDLTKL